MIELVFKMEEAFDVDIPNGDLTGIRTVGDTIAYVEGRLPPGTVRRAPKAAPRPRTRAAAKRAAAGRKPTRT